MTYIWIFSKRKTWFNGSSPFSFRIVTIRSTAKYNEFHLVLHGRINYLPQISSIISAAAVERLDLFHNADNLAKLRQYNFLKVMSLSAFDVSLHAMRCRI